MDTIKDISSREILDSRGNPTLETALMLDCGIIAKASVPSGASKGSHEAMEIRDNDSKRYHGLGVLSAIKKIHEQIKPLLIGKHVCDQKRIDTIMVESDGTTDRHSLGANSILSVSLACARAASVYLQKPLYMYIQQLCGCHDVTSFPTPLFNVINGGAHGNGNLTFQEFFFIPDKNADFPKALRMGVELYQLLKILLKSKNLNYSLGDEGGFTPALGSNKVALKYLKDTIDQSEYKYATNIFLGLDIAASTFYSDHAYHLSEKKNSLSYKEYMEYLVDLAKEFTLYSIEDPLGEDDWEGWVEFTKKLGSVVKVVGDDLLVTNKKRLEKAIMLQACNAILVKVNQIGTLSETLDVVKTAKNAQFTVIISHRSGETNDDFIADLAVGTCADFVKFGAPARGERVAKYNRLLEIYHELHP